ncbi:anion permease [Vibrio sinaloensis]|nr:anion permease [Vibrio sinaloensis]
MPIDAIPIDDLTLIQHRLLAIFLLAALLWVLEPVPVFATSILIIALELVMISDKGLHLFRNPPAGHELGELMQYTDIFSAFFIAHHHSIYGWFCVSNRSVKVRIG